MTTDSGEPAPGEHKERPGRLRPKVPSWPWRSAPADQMRTVTVRGRTLRVAVRRGNLESPPLLLCNGIGASLELLQPFVDALAPRPEGVPFGMPGLPRSPPPALPHPLPT